MSKLSDLEAAALARLGAEKSAVTDYITALKAKAAANKYWLGAGGVIGALVGWFAHKL